MKPKNVIVLAAGMGVRLRPITRKVPKALVHCAGLPLLAHALRFARRLLSDEGRIVVVTGFEGDLVRDYLGQEAPDVLVSHNPDFEKANLLSVGAGLKHVQGDFGLMNVDHLYPSAFADRFTSTAGACVAAIDSDRDLLDDDMKVELSGEGRVVNISKGLSRFDCGYIGMTLVRPDGFEQYLEAFERARDTRGDDAVAEDVLQLMADQGAPACTCDLSGLSWLEVDTLDDLQGAEENLHQDPDMIDRDW